MFPNIIFHEETLIYSVSPDTPKNENVYSPENVVSREFSPVTPKLLSRNFICNEVIYVYIYIYI
jgi:hypothetical protein